VSDEFYKWIQGKMQLWNTRTRILSASQKKSGFIFDPSSGKLQRNVPMLFRRILVALGLQHLQSVETSAARALDLPPTKDL